MCKRFKVISRTTGITQCIRSVVFAIVQLNFELIVNSFLAFVLHNLLNGLYDLTDKKTTMAFVSLCKTMANLFFQPQVLAPYGYIKR